MNKSNKIRLAKCGNCGKDHRKHDRRLDLECRVGGKLSRWCVFVHGSEHLCRNPKHMRQARILIKMILHEFAMECVK